MLLGLLVLIGLLGLLALLGLLGLLGLLALLVLLGLLGLLVLLGLMNFPGPKLRFEPTIKKIRHCKKCVQRGLAMYVENGTWLLDLIIETVKRICS